MLFNTKINLFEASSQGGTIAVFYRKYVWCDFLLFLEPEFNDKYSACYF